ncbi:BamA/TamA family outer membrane protein [Sulfurospirillum sp. T05]|uniref:BamA/TamA family outer membrane protein n=1 Tax=Sulfurospirillum tamanense TaxID=2813362 RepID=A0ABS2WPY1_9BACT|nr:BamA/TamA family outer membrane protein [Sulfurospirillum tamanensis]MBN2963570.1 BamA/TamA family outer membrane protein [Sulfurospirillum tamanensis]
MLTRFLSALCLVGTLHATPITTLHVTGDIDPLFGPFTKDTLLKVCNITFPPVYKFWQSAPVFSPEQISQCAQTLTQYAHSYGFYNTEVTHAINEDSASLHVKKNVPIRVASLEADEALRPFIDFAQGDVFTALAFSAAKRDIKDHFAALGYPKAELDTKAYVDLDAYKVDVHFRVTPRDLHTFGPITLSNNAKVDEALIYNAIHFKEGERYDARLLEKTYEELYGFGVYSYIALNQDFDQSNATVPVEVTLLQGDHREIQYGFGYDTDTGGRVVALYKNDNFYGNLKKFSLGGTLNEKGVSVYNSLFLPRLFLNDTLLKGVTLTNDITFENTDYDSYKQRKFDEKITFSKEFWGLKHGVGASSEISRITSKLPEYESGNYWINAVFYQVELDRRDNALNPKNGYYLSFTLENGTKLLASEEEYVKTLTEFRAMKTFDRLTFSFKTKVGTLDQDLPIFKRFFAGGDYSNRGYQYQKVGKKDHEDNPYGGLTLIDNSLELEYAFTKTLGITTFLDSTMLREKPNDFANDFYHSVGAGVRYYTPIGPLRLDIGTPLKEGGVVFHLGIGQVF